MQETAGSVKRFWFAAAMVACLVLTIPLLTLVHADFGYFWIAAWIVSGPAFAVVVIPGATLAWEQIRARELAAIAAGAEAAPELDHLPRPLRRVWGMASTLRAALEDGEPVGRDELRQVWDLCSTMRALAPAERHELERLGVADATVEALAESSARKVVPDELHQRVRGIELALAKPAGLGYR